jgi:thiol-disulfide isomerase/thioredoxin
LNLRGIAVVAVAAFAAAGGYYTYWHRAGVTQQPASPAPAPIPAKRLVASVPDFTLADRDGRTRTLHDWAGKALIVNFWATWCAPCRKEIPLLQRLQREHASDGFQVIGIAVDFREQVLAYASQMKIDYPLLIGEQEALDAASAFGVEVVGLPFTIFSDRQGRIVTAHMGELTPAGADLILGEVRAVDAGQKTLAQARASIESRIATLPPPADGGE